MMFKSLPSLLLLFQFQVQDATLQPARSPDHQILATTKVSERNVTPEGADYKLLLNDRPVYPKPKKHSWHSMYQDQHTFLTELRWSPDSQHLAFFEKVYSWAYSDPYNRDFEGTVSNERYFLVIVSRDGRVAGYRIPKGLRKPDLAWQSDSKVALNNRVFDLQANRPGPID
jgi:hypothetical protein